MRIAILGAGFTGLSAAYQLSKQGHAVTVFEKDAQPGGLAVGYREKGWDWSLEYHYHHWFTNDSSVLNLAKQLNYPVIIKRPKTKVYVEKEIFQFDSPKDVLLFPKLSPLERFRMAAAIGLIRYDPFWKPLEKFNAAKVLPSMMGKKAYKMIWEPLFVNKFGSYANDVSLAWFWARITKRTPSLAYPEGGFLAFAESLVASIKQQGGDVLFQHEIIKLVEEKAIFLSAKDHKGKPTDYSFDKVIVTLPSFLFVKIAPSLPEEYKGKLNRLKGIGAMNLVLRLREPFFKDNTYWLSICDQTAPIMAIVEHTNFMDKKNYNNEHLLYLGNYKAPDDPLFHYSKEKLLAHYDPFLQTINDEYKKHIIAYELFKAPFAQPIIPTNYSKMIPSMTTPFKNVYLANIEQVYPWDRGTNYAVELGEKVALLIKN